MKRVILTLSLVFTGLMFSQSSFAFTKIHLVQPLRTFVSPEMVPSATLLYYGGPVISNVKVISVFWGSNVDPTVTAKIGGFYAAITDSPYFDWLGEYNTNITAQGGSKGTNQKNRTWDLRR